MYTTGIEDSYDEYTCMVKNEPMYDCLDIGSANLGGSLSDTTAYNMSGALGNIESNFYATLALEESLLESGGMNSSNLFGADVQCSGKTVGDGAINTFDMSVLMWYQFKFEPYDQLPTDPTVVTTVGGRDGTPLRCNMEGRPEYNERRREWQLAIGKDYCHIPTGVRTFFKWGCKDSLAINFDFEATNDDRRASRSAARWKRITTTTRVRPCWTTRATA